MTSSILLLAVLLATSPLDGIDTLPSADVVDATLLQAVLTSWTVVIANPAPMAFWAALIVLFTLLGLGSLLIGLVAVVPMLGHASWHAYRDLVDASAFPAREQPEPGRAL